MKSENKEDPTTLLWVMGMGMGGSMGDSLDAVEGIVNHSGLETLVMEEGSHGEAKSSQTILVGNGDIEGLNIHREQEAVRARELEIVNMAKGIRGIADVDGQGLDKWRKDGVK
eukprot:g26473.t1